MHTRVIDIRTGTQEAAYDLTGECAAFLREVAGGEPRGSHAGGAGGASGEPGGGGRDGLLHVFVPHATAGVAIIETGSGSDRDLLTALGDLLPRDDHWQHRHGSPGHGRDHVVPAFVAPYAVLPVVDGRLALGTWQSVVLVDTNADNPGRKVRLSFLSG
jgi:secondary thiamine-phosphate synthase enzyme